ncbi:hypothetical protein EV2_035073 [Malus domestica]
MDFNDEVGIIELINFDLDDLALLYSVNTFSLDSRLFDWIQMEVMADYGGIYPLNVFCGPSKYVLVSSQENGKQLILLIG